ncbi:MAG: hypothetical protein ACM31C_26760 [Acidobacteriota bacterium]
MRALALAAVLAACHVPDVHFTPGGDAPTGDVPLADAASAGDVVWIRSLSAMLPLANVADTTGVTVTGYLNATADLGGAPLTSAGGADLVIASFAEADAAHQFSVRHGDIGNEYAWIDSDSNAGTPLVYGVSYGTVDLGQGQVAGGGGAGADGYIGSYAAGTAGWVQRIVGPGEDKILATALGPSSTVYGCGWFEQTTSFNNGTLTSAGGRDIFFARFNVFTGAVDLTKQYGGSGRDEISGAASSGNDLVLAGFFDDSFSFGNLSTTITANAGGLDLWIAKLASDGTAMWAVTFGGAGDDRDPRVAVDAAGDVYVTGTFTTAITLGPFGLTSAGGQDHFIAKLRGNDGSVVWARSFGSALDEHAGRVAVDGKGHVAWVGTLSGPLAGETSAGGNDAMIAEYSAADGSPLWHHVYSTSGDDGGGGVAYSSVTGDLIASITLGGSYDFGHPVIGAPSPIGVLLRLVP